MPKHIHLAFDISYTHLDGRWRMPGSWTGRTYPDLDIYEEIARISERGCIDMLFFGDGTGIPDTWMSSRDEAARWGIGWPRHDMSPVITAMSRVDEHVWLRTDLRVDLHASVLCGAAVQFPRPRHQRTDRLQRHRLEPGCDDAANCPGFDELIEHGLRYERMEEFIDVCRALWNSVEPEPR